MDYVIRVYADPCEIPSTEWDSLLARQEAPTPFMQHAYLAALHASGSATIETGWDTQFVTLWQAEKMVAAATLYIKAHSYGEYVFDWAWANAYAEHGLAYFPKGLSAVPFTPVPGSLSLIHI